MAPPRRTPAATPSLSMETSSMAPNHGVAATHEYYSGVGWRGLVLTTFLPLVFDTQTRSIENESGGKGLANMWMPFLSTRSNNQPKVVERIFVSVCASTAVQLFWLAWER